MAISKILINTESSGIVFTSEDILASFAEHELLISATYENGEFRVISTIGESFIFKLELQDDREKDKA